MRVVLVIWMHLIVVALLCHDVVHEGSMSETIKKNVFLMMVKEDWSNSSHWNIRAPLAPSCSRSKQFVNEHFVKNKLLDLEVITQCIERTRFPFRKTNPIKPLRPTWINPCCRSYRAAWRPGILAKIPALFYEFQELGQNQKWATNSPGNYEKDLLSSFGVW